MEASTNVRWLTNFWVRIVSQKCLSFFLYVVFLHVNAGHLRLNFHISTHTYIYMDVCILYVIDIYLLQQDTENIQAQARGQSPDGELPVYSHAIQCTCMCFISRRPLPNVTFEAV